MVTIYLIQLQFSNSLESCDENESFHDNLFLESIINNQEIPICWIENISEAPLNGSTFLGAIHKGCLHIFSDLADPPTHWRHHYIKYYALNFWSDKFLLFT